MLMMFTQLAVGEEAEHTGEHDAASHYHQNTIAGFIGITGEERRKKALTLGVEYERRFSETFGVVLSLERALGDLDFTVLTVPFAWHRGPWTFSAGPGIEFPDHDEHNEFLIRGSVLYVFDRGGHELAPKYTVDIVGGEVVLIGGLVIGFGF
jgi:hypothetical protein